MRTAPPWADSRESAPESPPPNNPSRGLAALGRSSRSSFSSGFSPASFFAWAMAASSPPNSSTNPSLRAA
ncbi:MAG: hypothetical protein ACK55I_22160, partial [bacterium]